MPKLKMHTSHSYTPPVLSIQEPNGNEITLVVTVNGTDVDLGFFDDDGVFQLSRVDAAYQELLKDYIAFDGEYMKTEA